MTDPATEPLVVRMRAADPAAAHATPTEAEIDAALARVRARLVDAPRRPRLRWRPALVVAAGSLAVAAAALVVVLTASSPSSRSARMLSGREARMVLHGAAARLAVAPGGVLETAYSTVEGGHGRVVARVRNEI